MNIMLGVMKKLLAIVFVLSYMGVKAQLTSVLTFTGTNGATPYGSLCFDGTFFYGLTADGGVNNLGTIFKIKPDGSAYTKLLDFNDTNGAHPMGSLISDSVFLYGTTKDGGASGYGTVFKIKPDGTGYTNLFSFNDWLGAQPTGSLLYDGVFLYGMTSGGGADQQDYDPNNMYGVDNSGVIFKIKPDGTNFDTLMVFSDTIINGSTPQGSLITDGTYLYGMTSAGGVNNLGTVFKIKPDGSFYSKLLDFNGTNGNTPYGDLLYDGTFLYGMTARGSSNLGIIFKIRPDGSGYNVLHNFTYTAEYAPLGTLISDGIFLYGTTYGGGVNSIGTVFKIKPNGTNFDKLADFSGESGYSPHGNLTIAGNYLYGMNLNGGTQNYNGKGVLFKLCLNKPTILIISSADSICVGDSVILIANGANTYTWTVYGYPNVGTSINVAPTVTTNYFVMGAIADGTCTNTDTIAVNVRKCHSVTVNLPQHDIIMTPNPSDNMIKLTSSQLTENTIIPITNTLGQEVMPLSTTYYNPGIIIMDVSNLPRGIYFIKTFKETKKLYKY